MATATHVPPQNIEAEESVLGAMLVAEPALSRVIDEVKLKPVDFYRDGHRVIFEAITDLYAASKPVDSLSVAEAIAARPPVIINGKKMPAIDVAGGKHYVSELAAKVPAAGNAKHYAEIVEGHALERAKREIGLSLADGLDPALALEQLAAVQRRRCALTGDGVRATSFASIEREEIRWLWPDRVPLGMLTMLMGDPGLGKSLLTTMLAAKVSRGGADVLMLSAEDHKGATIRPRLEAAKADLERVHVVEVKREGVDEGINLPDDGAELDRLAEETGARLIIVDPLMAHLPESVNSWSDQSVRRALAPLYHLSANRQCAVVVVNHLNKGKGGNAHQRSGGSIAIPAAVRSVLFLARDPEDPDGERGGRRVLAHAKCNVGHEAESLNCEIQSVSLDGGLSAPRMLMGEASDISAKDLLGADVEQGTTDRDEAVEFLETELATGPVPATEIKSAAGKAFISERTLRRAKEKLGVESKKDGMGGWRWHLPEQGGHPPAAEQGGQAEQEGAPYIHTVAPFDSRAKYEGNNGTEGKQGGHPEIEGWPPSEIDAEEQAA